jgi:hypothetical protein
MSMDNDKKAQQAVEETGQEPTGTNASPAPGPHAKERPTDKSKTPGAGTLPDPVDDSVTPGSG